MLEHSSLCTCVLFLPLSFWDMCRAGSKNYIKLSNWMFCIKTYLNALWDGNNRHYMRLVLVWYLNSSDMSLKCSHFCFSSSSSSSPNYYFLLNDSWNLFCFTVLLLPSIEMFFQFVEVDFWL